MPAKKPFGKSAFFVYVFFALFYLWLAAQIPYAHDDWDWGISIGMQQFLNATVNSRYMGNLLEIIMTRSVFLKTVIMGATYFMIPYLLSGFAANTPLRENAPPRTFLFIVCNFLILTMNRLLWRQTYGWVAGFSNFAISAVFLMLWIKELLLAIDDSVQRPKDSLIIALLYFVASVCGQLFLENMAIYCFCLAIALCIIHRTKTKHIPKRVIFMLTGAFVGLILMFSSNLYGTLLQTGSAINNYRQIPLLSGGTAKEILYNSLVTILYLVVRMYSLNAVLTITVLLLFIGLLVFTQRTQPLKHFKRFLILNISLTAAFLFCFLYDRVCTKHSVLMYGFDFCVSIGYFLTIFFETVLLFKGKLKSILLSLWLSAPLIIAPVAVTTTTGHRLFFTSNIFIILFALICLIAFLKYLPEKKSIVIKHAFLCFTAIMICFYGVVYAGIGSCNRTRMAIIESAVENGAQTITLPKYPFPLYLHGADPTTEVRTEYFKQFYGIPEDTQVFFK